MKAYKGFNKDMTCQGFQYEEGKTYETDEAKMCESGFHACEDPLDCFSYYYPAESVYREVEIEDNGERQSNDTKVVGKKITIGAEISVPLIAKAHVEWIKEKITNEKVESNTGSRSVATNTGYWSAATNTGDWSAATNTGYQSAATNTGSRSVATNTGSQSAATNTGYRSVATNTGDWSAASVKGKESVAIVTGYHSKVKGALGCAIVAAERGEWNGETYPLLAIKSGIVDGKKIKPDTWYTVKNGEWAEVK